MTVKERVNDKRAAKNTPRQSANLGRKPGAISHINYFAGFANFSLDFLEIFLGEAVRTPAAAANTYIEISQKWSLWSYGPMRDRSDVEAILDEVLRGQTEAFGQIVRDFALPLRSYLASQVHHVDDVDDLAQEVFLAALGNLSTFRRGDDFGAWLRGIARNKILVYFRTQSRRSQALKRFRDEVAALIEGDLERDAAGDSAEMMERLLRCVAHLPERLRRVVRAGLDGDKPAEVAKTLATTVGVVYNLHYRANQLLRECLRKEVE
jgi:RNA polymerase sigma-70 factor (ECF subfamily)